MKQPESFLPEQSTSQTESTYHTVYVIEERILGRWVSSTTYRSHELDRARSRLALIRTCHPTTGFRLVRIATTIQKEVILP